MGSAPTAADFPGVSAQSFGCIVDGGGVVEATDFMNLFKPSRVTLCLREVDDRFHDTFSVTISGNSTRA